MRNISVISQTGLLEPAAPTGNLLDLGFEKHCIIPNHQTIIRVSHEQCLINMLLGHHNEVCTLSIFISSLYRLRHVTSMHDSSDWDAAAWQLSHEPIMTGTTESHIHLDRLLSQLLLRVGGRVWGGLQLGEISWMGGRETEVWLGNAGGPLLPRPCRGLGRTERRDREAHTGCVWRSAEDWCRG